MRCLILGNGPAGIAAAKAIRGRDAGAEILVVGDEAAAPYLRPLLTDVISGERLPETLVNPQAADLAEQGIAMRLCAKATHLDPRARTVEFSDGTTERYDALLIATGGRPAIPHKLRGFKAQVVALDSLGNALRIRDRATASGVVAVLGPGFLAAVTALSLRKAGRSIVWMKPGEPRFGNPEGGKVDAEVLAAARAAGIVVLDGAGIGEAHAEGDGLRLTPSRGGDPVVVSMVVIATERHPNTAFLRGSGVESGIGVLVDDALRTNLPGIFAAGDCAELYDKTTHESRFNFGWRSAMAQGHLAGENMAGAGKAYLRTRDDYFWRLFGPPLRERFGPR
ncbi:MAG TPA: NAD(P)/FAD-dependent oxidoreductase [Candidatus Deferrimicrobiaceae bacterium]|jgi:NADPH-dependent 2,4-dienoyl-CoA reductase/sulfur reductase-like enzyme